MKWWKSRKPKETIPGDDPDIEGAMRERRAAEQDLARAQKSRKDVERMVSSLRNLREEDPLTLLFLESLKGNSKRPEHG